MNEAPFSANFYAWHPAGVKVQFTYRAEDDGLNSTWAEIVAEYIQETLAEGFTVTEPLPVEGERVEHITGYVIGSYQSKQSGRDEPCLQLYGGEHLKWRIVTVYPEKFEDFAPVVDGLPANAKHWEGAAPERGDAVRKGYFIPCNCKVKLTPRFKDDGSPFTNEDGKVRLYFDTTVEMDGKPWTKPAPPPPPAHPAPQPVAERVAGLTSILTALTDLATFDAAQDGKPWTKPAPQAEPQAKVQTQAKVPPTASKVDDEVLFEQEDAHAKPSATRLGVIHGFGTKAYAKDWDNQRHYIIEQITHGKKNSIKDLTNYEANLLERVVLVEDVAQRWILMHSQNKAAPLAQARVKLAEQAKKTWNMDTHFDLGISQLDKLIAGYKAQIGANA